MLEMLAAQGISSFMGGLGKAIGGDSGPLLSGGGSIDARSFMDGSGWTVSTGSSRATGGARQQSGDPWGAPSLPDAAGTQQAGFGGTAGLLLVLVLAGMIWRAKS